MTTCPTQGQSQNL